MSKSIVAESTELVDEVNKNKYEIIEIQEKQREEFDKSFIAYAVMLARPDPFSLLTIAIVFNFAMFLPAVYAILFGLSFLKSYYQIFYKSYTIINFSCKFIEERKIQTFERLLISEHMSSFFHIFSVQICNIFIFNI